MGFEFDEQRAAPTKPSTASTSSRLRRLWADDALVEVPARSDAEARFLVVGTDGRQALVCLHHLPGRDHPADLRAPLASGGGGDL